MKIPRLSALALLFSSALVASSLQPPTLVAQSIFGVRYDMGRQRTFDVLHTAIDVRFDEPRREVIGSVRHRLRPIIEELATVSLDADSAMRIARVTVDDVECGYRLGVRSLEIDLPKPARDGDTIEIAIDYRVRPSKGLYILAPDSTNPTRRAQIWTQGEAEDHHYWVPLYDFPNDRATSEMTITVRERWSALSNGDLVSRRSNNDGTATWHYRFDRPHASYLIMMAAGEYLVTRDTVDGIPLSYWTYPEFPERVAPAFASTPDVMRYLTRRIGIPYPWKSYAQVVVSEYMYGGMENTTASTLNDEALVDARGRIDYNTDNLIAHELAHQWFGDLVTTSDWGHLWVQESFATYLASKYLGHRYGEDALLNDIWEGGVRAIALDSTSGRDPIAGGKGQITNLYQRGAHVLYMLEHLLGEEPFWRGVRLFLERHAYSNVETADLQDAFEDASGVELDWFFRQWVYRAGAPELVVSHTYDGDSLRIRFRQAHVRDSLTGLFRLRLPIAIHHDDGIVRDTIWLDAERDSLTLPLASKPTMVLVDEGQSTLKRLRHERTDDELVAQLEAPAMLDRWEAVTTIVRVDSARRAEPWRLEALARAYRREPTAAVRDAIIGRIGELEGSEVGSLVAEAFTDSSVDVRRAAIELSYRIVDPVERAEALRARLADSSVRVVASALSMLATTDTTGLRATLAKWRGVTGRRQTMAQAWVGAVSSARLDELIDDVVVYTRAPYNRSTRWQAFIALSALSRTTPAVREAIIRGLTDSSASVREAAIEAAHTHLDAELRTRLAAVRETFAGEERRSIDAMLDAN